MEDRGCGFYCKVMNDFAIGPTAGLFLNPCVSPREDGGEDEGK